MAVCLTVAAVAGTARLLLPAMPWAAAFALGAIVAPPDAVSAMAILRQVRLPHRLAVILAGESLLNDASALLIYRLAVGAMIGGMTIWTGPLLVLACAGGLLLGFAAARFYLAVAARVPDGSAAVVLQFLSTFGVWLIADTLGLSANFNRGRLCYDSGALFTGANDRPPAQGELRCVGCRCLRVERAGIHYDGLAA